MKLINVEQICSITTVKGKFKDYRYKIVKERKNWLGKTIPEHIVDTQWPTEINWSSVESFLKDAGNGYSIINAKIYLKPHIKFSMSDGKLVTKYFENESKMNSFIEHKLKDINLEIIEQ